MKAVVLSSLTFKSLRKLFLLSIRQQKMARQNDAKIIHHSTPIPSFSIQVNFYYNTFPQM